MKNFFVAVIVLLSAGPAMALEEVKVSGAIEIQYRVSDDYYDDSAPLEYPSISDNGERGSDVLRPEELYLQVSAKIDEGVEGLIKLDGADMDRNSGDDSKYVEEAQVIFTNLGLRGLTIVAGKDEMPFGQDYEQFLLNSATHELEIDKVWGLHGIYHFSGIGRVAAAVFEADRDAETSVQDSFAARGTMDELIKNLSVEVSVARRGEDDSIPAQQDETRINAGAVFKWGDFTFHAEQSLISNFDNQDDRDLQVTQVGADFRFRDFLFKARQEVIDDDNPVAGAESQELRVAGGASYYFSDKAFAALEYEFTKWDIADDSNEVLFGVKFIF